MALESFSSVNIFLKKTPSKQEEIKNRLFGHNFAQRETISSISISVNLQIFSHHVP